MKKAILLYVLTLTAITVYSQKWEQIYGDPNRNDFAEGINEFYDNGNYIIAGYEGDGWVIKTDINGEELYNTVFTHDLYDFKFLSAASDDEGNLYICGFLVAEAAWPLVIKMNTCGEKIWCKVFMKYEYDDGYATDIVINNNEIVVLVDHNSNDQVDQIFLYGLNDSGDLLWINTYASADIYPNIGVAYGSNLYQFENNYIIDGYCYWPYPGNPGQVYLRPLFIKINSQFNEEWILPFGIADSIVGVARGTLPLNDSTYFGIGERRSSATYNKNSLLMFFNEKGEEIGYNQVTNEDFGENVEFNTMWNIVRANDTSFITKFYMGINDTVFHGETVIDTEGSLLKIKNRGLGNGIADIIKTSDNNFLQATEVEESKGDKDIWLYKFDENLEPVPIDTNNYVYDSLCPGGIQSGTIDITNCLIWTSVEETPSPQEYYTSLKTIHIKAYPNPVKDGNVTFEFQNTSLFPGMVFKCFDVFGREVYSEKVYQNQGESKIKLSGWNEGLYIAIILNNSKPIGNCKFMIK